MPASRLRSWLVGMVAALMFTAVGAARAQTPPVSVERYRIDVRFQPEKSFLHAKGEVTLRARQPVTNIEFELNPSLKILSVTGARGETLTFVRSQRLGSPRLVVTLPAPQDGEFTLTFVYEGRLPEKPLDYITAEGILLRDESRWYPAVDLSAFTWNDIALTLPPCWEGVASGERAGEDLTAGSVTIHWKTSSPVSSRAIVATPKLPAECSSSSPEAANSPKSSGDSAGPPIRVVGTRQGEMESLAAQARGPVAFFRKLLGKYPQNRFTIVQGFPGQQGAIGYSAPGFLVVSKDAVKFAGNIDYAPEFLPHEIAHQWFPIEVTIAREEDGWLAESVAEYLAWRYLEAAHPVEARRMVALAMRGAMAPEPLPPLSLGLKLFALERWSTTQATLYDRGMLVWRTLETVIDRERVDRALREYYARYAGRSGSIADFQKICQEISGRDLGWFFDYYIRGTQIPEIRLRRLPAGAPNEVSGEIIVENVPADFSVRVELRLETPAGPIEHSIATRGRVTPFAIPTTAQVTRIVLEPRMRILRWTEAARRYRAQVALLADAGELERAGKLERAAEKCRQALAADPEDAAANAQAVRFQLGRIEERRKRYDAAFAEMGRVLAMHSLAPMDTDFNRAWAHVYRARIEKLRGHAARARAEARAGLAIHSPALETVVFPPGEYDEGTTAAAELAKLAGGKSR